MKDANFSPEQIDKIIKDYLKGSVEIKHLAILHDCSAEAIEYILTVNEIDIVSNQRPPKKTKPWFWIRKRRT